MTTIVLTKAESGNRFLINVGDLRSAHWDSMKSRTQLVHDKSDPAFPLFVNETPDQIQALIIKQQ